jgi:predicted membrane chloride channel (bestrophin family)
MWPTISIIIGAVLLVFLAVVIILQRKNFKNPPDYYNLFTMGLMWFLVGIPFAFDGSYVFIAVGIILGGIGLANKKKWKENRRKWGDLAPKERSIKRMLIIFLGAFVLAGLLAYLLSIK